MPAQQRTTTVTPSNLRGLAHPVRVQILNILWVDGPSTSTVLAERLQVRTGTTSWHLQKLAEHGFIEELPERGNKRDRWWKAVSRGYSIDAAALMADPELAGRAATVLLEQINQYFQRASRFVHERWSRKWRSAWMLNGWDDIHLTPDLLHQLRDDMFELARKYRELSDETNPEAETVAIQVQAFPYRAGQSS